MSRLSTFANLGTNVEEATSVNEVLKMSNLDFEVVTQPIYTMHNGELMEYPGKVATVNKETGEQLGVVSDSYQVCQNQDAFDFVDYISSDLKFVKAGQTKGHLIYMIGQLPDIPVLGDDITPYVIFQNSHDGQSSVRATISPLRFVCQNQFNISFRDSSNTLSIRHSGEIAAKLEEGREMLANVANYMDVFRNGAESLAAKKMNKRQINKVFDTIFRYDPKMMSERQIINFEQKRDEFFSCLDCDDNQNLKRTAWGVVNGFADFTTHKKLSDRENAAESAFLNTSILSRDMTKLYTMLEAI